MSNVRGFLAVAVSIIALVAALPAAGQETLPGDACVAGQLDHIRLSGGPETSGVADILRCNGATWQSQIRFMSTGSVGVGNLAPTAAFDVTKGFAAGSTGWGENAQFLAYSTGNSASYLGVSALTATANAGATGAAHEAYGISANVRTGNDATAQKAFGVTSQLRLFNTDTGYGVVVDDDNASAAGGTAYGVYINLDDADLTRYGIYQISANPNYFAGTVGVGTPSPQAPLHVAGEAIIGKGTLACGAAQDGALRFTSSTDAWEFCNGSAWVPFEQNLSGPPGCVSIGDLCADGTVFAGWHPITHENLFIATTDQGTTSQWKTTVGANDIATDSVDDGRANTNQVANSTTFPAFKLCKDLATGGHSDWYLPSRVEAYYLWSVRDTIDAAGNITDFQNAYYWSSSEQNNNLVWTQQFSGGNQDVNSKTNAYRVRCVRR
ncbi:DUF1566 domain-containing protein [Arvimicrobium flavum]|uniref:Lcl C-terminal domain-containing protein n=1 Tax=Arvimicrobium flavum TaxID=3393320 RepID=UPI00237B6763|nr:DUF1566 domain-containing protein [Mesorhizobium shangrilense]